VTAGTHRPADDEYWISRWSRVLFSGDIFEAIPFAGQPTMVFADEDEEPAKHYIGEVAFAYGLLVSPTCDMYEQLAGEARPAHPYRVLVPILPLESVAEAVESVERNVALLRSRDSIVPYMYLPPLDEVLEEESVACLFRPTLVSDDFLREPPRRVAQMHPEARRQLKIKLARYWARVDVNRQAIPLHERDEDDVRSDDRPPSAYDLA
jgi:hypothetical protein